MARGPAAVTVRPETRSVELDGLRQRVDDLRIAIGWDVDEVRSRLRDTFDVRRQAARHPFVAAAVVLGGLLVAAGLARSLLRAARAPGASRIRGGRGRDSRDLAQGPGRGPGARPARMKEVFE